MSTATARPDSSPAPSTDINLKQTEPVTKTAKARQIVDDALDALAQELNNGKSAGFRRYLSVAARFHEYSFSNIMLIHSQRPNATQVAGYRAWQKLGRQVRKGEKGITIMAPMIFKPKDADNSDEDVFVRFRAVSVFDIAQTDGDPLPLPPQVSGDPGHHWEHLTRFVQNQGIAILYDSLKYARGKSRGGTIILSDQLDDAERFSVLVHELAHELMHMRPSRTRSRPPENVRELEAESVAFVVCSAVGLATGTASSDYIQNYGGNAEMLEHSLRHIKKTAERILVGLLGDPEDEAKDAEPAET